MIISIGGTIIKFHLPRHNFSGLVKRHYKPFATNRRRPFDFEVFFLKKSSMPFKPSIKADNGLIVFQRGDFHCALDLKSGKGKLEINNEIQSFDSFLRTFMSWHLIRSGGFLVHAASAVINGRGYLFVGKSGAGKSTISKMMIKELGEKKFPLLTPPYTLYPIVLTDELSIVRIIGDKIRIYPSPFWGEMKNPRYETGAGGKNELEDLKEGVDLARIFFLKKSRKNKILSSPDRESYKNMLKCVMNFSKNKYAALNLMRSLSTILERIESSKLYFSKTGIFGELWRGQACK